MGRAVDDRCSLKTQPGRRLCVETPAASTGRASVSLVGTLHREFGGDGGLYRLRPDSD